MDDATATNTNNKSSELFDAIDDWPNIKLDIPRRLIPSYVLFNQGGCIATKAVGKMSSTRTPDEDSHDAMTATANKLYALMIVSVTYPGAETWQQKNQQGKDSSAGSHQNPGPADTTEEKQIAKEGCGRDRAFASNCR